MILVKWWWVPGRGFWENIRFRRSRQNTVANTKLRRWRLLGLTVTWQRGRESA